MIVRSLQYPFDYCVEFVHCIGQSSRIGIYTAISVLLILVLDPDTLNDYRANFGFQHSLSFEGTGVSSNLN